MASALIGGLIRAGFLAAAISVIEVSAGARERLAARHRCASALRPTRRRRNPTRWCLPVKPRT